MTMLELWFIRQAGGVRLGETKFSQAGRELITAFQGPRLREQFPWSKGVRAFSSLMLTLAARGLRASGADEDGVLAVDAASRNTAYRYRELFRVDRCMEWPDVMFGTGGYKTISDHLWITKRGLVLNDRRWNPGCIRAFVDGVPIVDASVLERLAEEIDRRQEKEPPPPPTDSIETPPDGPVSHGPYVVRTADGQFVAAIDRRDGIVRVQGIRYTGKTSLIVRGLRRARGDESVRVVFTHLRGFDTPALHTIEAFYRTLANDLEEELDLPVSLDDIWDSKRGANDNFNAFLRGQVFDEDRRPLIWVLDGIDYLLAHGYSGDVFRLLRTLHEKRSTHPAQPWRLLTLVLAHRHPPYLFIDPNHSPLFNIGTGIDLRDFTVDELEELNRQRGSPLRDSGERDRFYDLLGGHPLLANRGLYEMVKQRLDISAFEARAEDIFAEHLRSIIPSIQGDRELYDALRAVVRGGPPLSRDNFYRLHADGVLVGDWPDAIRIRCRLYELYLEGHLP